ncbi:uncharacterized protein LOC119685242 [Teleopsis dalmanni]|uniref:uncharacterized protein LOC119685231 n=1 Tax=Teleopsis dalmanni TaxID=139649 RepID=UPI0018CD4415|nr:uncharacterized protein LOC119685231 [Teleopsis dalmanni]XP_037955405.1 uncharacterized protein LOC119685242 [Teleopsis dalmanni]
MSNLRVIVQLNDIDAPDHFELNRKNRLDRETENKKYINTNLQLIDDHTLLVTSNAPSVNADSQSKILRHLHFSFLGFASEVRTVEQIHELLDQLLLKRKNSCLIRFNALRECQIRFLSNFLCKEVQKRLKKTKTTVDHIKLEYYNLHKYNLVNVMSTMSSGRKESISPAGLLFHNFSQLQKWLRTDYTNLFSFGTGHECFDFQFSLTDTHERKFRLNFSLIHYYLCIIDGDTKADMKNVLENSTSRAAVNNTMIVKCLREYLVLAKKSWQVDLLFDIPIIDSDSGNIITEDILQVACAAETGLKVSVSDSKYKLESSRSGIMTDPSTSRVTAKRSQYISTSQIGLRKSPSIPLARQKACVLSTADLNNISFWHCKIDEKFSNVLYARESYYNYKFETKVGKMCTDIKQMVHKSSFVVNSSSKERIFADELDKLKKKYQLALSSFETLLLDVEKSEYSKELSIYYQMKKYELIQHSLRFKVRQLEQCQNRLSSTIDDEMSLLQNMKKVSSDVSNANSKHV